MSNAAIDYVDVLHVGSINLGEEVPALQTLVGTDTLATNLNCGTARTTAAAARTGFIIPKGTYTGQLLMVFLESAAANTVTAAAAGTSFIAGGTTVVLSGLEAHLFVYNAVTALWYSVGPVAQ